MNIKKLRAYWLSFALFLVNRSVMQLLSVAILFYAVVSILSAPFLVILPVIIIIAAVQSVSRLQEERAFQESTRQVSLADQVAFKLGEFSEEDTVVVADADLLDKWSSIKEGKDLLLSGRDAEMLARALELGDIRAIYDQDAASVEALLGSIENVRNKEHLSVKVKELPYRIPHGTRALQAAEQGAASFHIQDQELLAVRVQNAVLEENVRVSGESEALSLLLASPNKETHKNTVEHSPLAGIDVPSGVLIIASLQALEALRPTSLNQKTDVYVYGEEAEITATTYNGTLLSSAAACWSDLEDSKAEALRGLLRRDFPLAGVFMEPHTEHYLLTRALRNTAFAEIKGRSGVGKIMAVRLPRPGRFATTLQGPKKNPLALHIHFLANPDRVYLPKLSRPTWPLSALTSGFASALLPGLLSMWTLFVPLALLLFWVVFSRRKRAYTYFNVVSFLAGVFVGLSVYGSLMD